MTLDVEVATALISAVVTAIATLWAWGHRGWRAWATEVKSTAALLRRIRRSEESARGEPTSDPPESWDDTTSVHARRAAEDKRWLDDKLRRYLSP